VKIEDDMRAASCDTLYAIKGESVFFPRWRAAKDDGNGDLPCDGAR
jgi:hypothetical protein